MLKNNTKQHKYKLFALIACALGQSCHATINDVVEIIIKTTKAQSSKEVEAIFAKSPNQLVNAANYIKEQLNIKEDTTAMPSEAIVHFFTCYWAETRLKETTINNETVTKIFKTKEVELARCCIYIFAWWGQKKFVELIALLGNLSDALSDQELKENFSKVMSSMIGESRSRSDQRLVRFLEQFQAIHTLSASHLVRYQNDLTSKTFGTNVSQVFVSFNIQAIMEAQIATLIAIKGDRKVINAGIVYLNSKKQTLVRGTQNETKLIDSLISKLESQLNQSRPLLVKILFAILIIFIMIIVLNIVNIWTPIPSILGSILFT